MMREIKAPLNDILSLVMCVEVENDFLLEGFAELIGYTLSESEITTYAEEVKNTEGYSVLDYEDVRQHLRDFKTKYCPL